MPGRKPAPAPSGPPAGSRIVVENVNVPGYTYTVDAVKYTAMLDALRQILPTRPPGLTQDELLVAVAPRLPQDVFPQGTGVAGWIKTVQLDQEAKGGLIREPSLPPRWHALKRTTSSYTVRRLHEDDIHRLVLLRREALSSDPQAFSAPLDGDVLQDPLHLRRLISQETRDAIFGAFEGDLVGMVGAYRETRDKVAHKACLWGMYVTPECRRRGIAAALLSAAIEFVRGLSGVTHLYVEASETMPASIGLYEKAGFVAWGTEPAGLKVAGTPIATRHMVLCLEGTGAALAAPESDDSIRESDDPAGTPEDPAKDHQPPLLRSRRPAARRSKSSLRPDATGRSGYFQSPLFGGGG